LCEVSDPLSAAGFGRLSLPEVSAARDFLDADTGETLSEVLHPRPQTDLENCTWHNYNVVPTKRGKVLVSGNYQSGVSVVDPSDPTLQRRSRTRTRWWSRIRPSGSSSAATGRRTGTTATVYESDMTGGLLVWKLFDRAVRGARTTTTTDS
jgi:hypothetical protein